MALFKKRKSTKEKLAEKKAEMNQKKQGKLKAASVKDLTREVKSNKKIGSRDAARTANKQFGERVNKIFNLFSLVKHKLILFDTIFHFHEGHLMFLYSYTNDRKVEFL